MNIVSWNCSQVLRQKYVRLKPIMPDFAIIPECESLEKLGDAYKELFPKAIWYGDNPWKGLGVFATSQYELSVHPAYDDQYKWIVPISVSGGTENLTIIAVWTKNHKIRNLSYIGQLYMALQQYKSLLQTEQCIVVGDLNSNAIWDYYSRVGNHTAVVDLLRGYGIESAYHHFYGEPHGQETRPTHYFRYDQKKPFHIDYVFAPINWLSRMQTVEVGTYDDWRDAPSDHVPLIVKFLSERVD
ncbi:endonuclease/exonuclease/phosphatase family protein [Paenibacillus glycanilyticus]|uniref:Endonuclease/exonuclease/phosphatase family protein n=1 Tax=Paenibacillus glycanilyticus TaxID=126569 RepID=A0ABQ6GJY3_9BACL|nr:endonuclease/exonuclease/phosphatase family protein [Paenibacillus glycanilyticus]GLX70815.1 endonuclease/exonuclease/phosphatase family protein [Paenibacillus glycanilyticus]